MQRKEGRGESMDRESAWRQAGFLPLAEGLFYFPCGDAPLSAEVFLIPGRECTWFFDCGNGEYALNALRAVPGRKRAVISHSIPITWAMCIRRILNGCIWAILRIAKSGTMGVPWLLRRV